MKNEAFEKQKGKGITSTEQARLLGSMGGRATALNIKRKKSMKELAQMMGDCNASKEIAEKMKVLFPDLDPKDITNKAVILAKQYEKANRGDSKAFEVIRDTGGERPDQHNTLDIKWGHDIGKSPAFSNDSIILGIQHGLVKLSVIDLDKVSAMIDVERESRVIVVEESTE